MALARVHTWAAGEVLLASDLNAEYNNLLNNAADLVSPFTKAISMGGFALNFDAANTIAMTGTTSGVSLTGGTLREGAEDTITAHAGGTQALATALSVTKKFHRISVCATTADSVVLPTSTVGQWHYIRNDGAAAAQVFGTTPDTINSVATATGVPLPTGMGCLYVCTTAGNWTASQSPVSVSGNFAVTFTATAATNVTLPTSGTLAILGANTFTGAQTTNATSGFNESKTTVASAAGPDIWTSTGNLIDYTGTVTATSFAAAPQAGVRRTLLCAGAAVFTAGANMLIQGVASGSNFTAAAGDQIDVVAVTTTQFRLTQRRDSGIPSVSTQTANTVYAGPTSGGAAAPAFRAQVAADVVGLALNAGTSTATTSGTSIDFTSTITSPKRVTVCLVGVSTNGTDNYYLQIGPSGGVVSSGYLGASSTLAAGTASSNYTAAFGIRFSDATNPIHGSITLTLENASSNTWVASGMLAQSGAAQTITVAGSIALSGTLNKLRLTTSGGTNTFDAGEMNVIWE